VSTYKFFLLLLCSKNYLIFLQISSEDDCTIVKTVSTDLINSLKKAKTKLRKHLLKVDNSITDDEDLLDKISRLVSILESSSVSPVLQMSMANQSLLVTSSLQSALQMFRQVVALENTTFEGIDKFNSISCSLRDDLHFYWRWICEMEPNFENKINELIHSKQNSKPLYWIILDETDEDKPVLCDQIEESLIDDQNLRRIFASIKRAMKSKNETNKLCLGTVTIHQSTWTETNLEENRFVWMKRKNATNKKNFTLYTMYSSQ
jgi:hypothetical protein